METELEEIIDDIKYGENKKINDISIISTQSIIKNEHNEENLLSIKKMIMK